MRILDKYVNGSWWGGGWRGWGCSNYRNYNKRVIKIIENIFMLSYSLIHFDSFLRLNNNVLLDPRPRPEGSYKIWSVRPSVFPSFHPSFHLSVSLIGICSLVFSESQHGVRGHIQLCVTAGFFRKNPHRAKITKNGQKWPKNMVFGLCRKIMSLVSFGICVK